MTQQERGALDAVARRYSAKVEKSSSPHGATLIVGGKRVAVDIATLKPRGARQGNEAKPHLRFDKVATRVIERLRAAVGKTAADGTTVALTMTAPIRLASKTIASLEAKIQTLLARRSAARDEKATIHGNRVVIRIVRSGDKRAPRMIGFVHNPESDARLLLDMTGEMLELLVGAAGGRSPKRTGDRWLIVISAAGSSRLEAYRYIFSQLGPATSFAKILVVFGDGNVGELTE